MDSANLHRFWDLAGACTAAAEAGAPGFEAEIRPGYWAVSTDLPVWSGNWFAAHALGDGIVDALTAYVDGLVARGRTAVGWITAPALAPVGTVTERGQMTLGGTMPLMCRTGAPARDDRPAYAGTVARVADPSRMAPALEVMGKAFDVAPAMLELELPALLDHPEMTLHVAERDGAVESMCLTFRDGSDCYVYVMATDPERQRQGAGREVLQRAMEAAVADGVERFGLLASAAGQPLYRSLGYETVETAGFWIVNPQQPEA